MNKLILDEGQIKDIEFERRKLVYFKEIYKLEKKIIVEKRRQYIGDKNLRNCIFCKGTSPGSKIDGSAHAVPKQLGFNIFSFRECTFCNTKIFHKYESHLAHFLAPYRSMWSLGGNPKYKNDDTGLTISPSPEVISIKSSILGDPAIRLDSERNRMITEIPIHNHKLVLVIKALVKAGLALIEEDEIANFNETINWLMKDEKVEMFDSFQLPLLMHIIQSARFRPSISLYKRKIIPLDEKSPEKCIVITFGKMLIQFLVPFSIQDIRLNKHRGIHWTMPLCPIILEDDTFPPYELRVYKDMNSWEDRTDMAYIINDISNSNSKEDILKYFINNPSMKKEIPS
jgi:hypothetical protein